MYKLHNLVQILWLLLILGLLAFLCISPQNQDKNAPEGQIERKSGYITIEGTTLMLISPMILPKTQVLGVITSYNPLPEQTDDNPDITASGHKVREGIVANNCLPFGTRVEIDGEIFVVLDRMNSRYGCEHFDILSFDYEWSIQFGRQYKDVVIY